MKKAISYVLILTIIISVLFTFPGVSYADAIQITTFSSLDGNTADGNFDIVLHSGTEKHSDGRFYVGAGQGLDVYLKGDLIEKSKNATVVFETEFRISDAPENMEYSMLRVAPVGKSVGSLQPILRTLATTHSSYPSAVQFYGMYRSDSRMTYGSLGGAKVRLKLFLDVKNDRTTTHCLITEADGTRNMYHTSPTDNMSKFLDFKTNGFNLARLILPEGSIINYVKLSLAENCDESMYFSLGALDVLPSGTANNPGKVRAVLDDFYARGSFDFGDFVSGSDRVSDTLANQLLDYIFDEDYCDNAQIQSHYNQITSYSIDYPSHSSTDAFKTQKYASTTIDSDGVNIAHTFSESGLLSSVGGFHVEFTDPVKEFSKSKVIIAETEFTFGTVDDKSGANGNHERILCLVNYPDGTTPNYQPIFQTLLRSDRTEQNKKFRGFGGNDQPCKKYLTKEDVEGAHFKLKLVIDMERSVMALHVRYTKKDSNVPEFLHGFVDLNTNATYASFKTHGIKYIKMYPPADSVVRYLKVTMLQPDEESIFYALASAGNASKGGLMLEEFSAKGMFDLGDVGENVNIETDIIPLLMEDVADKAYVSNREIQDAYNKALLRALGNECELSLPYILDNGLYCGYGTKTIAELISEATVSEGAKIDVLNYDGSPNTDINSEIHEGMRLKVTSANGTKSKEYCLGYPKYAEFEPLVNFDSGFFRAEFNVKSYVADEENYLGVAACYSGNRLTGVDVARICVNDIKTYTATASAPATVENGEEYRAFLLNESLKPVKSNTGFMRNSKDLRILSIGDSITGNYEPGYPGYIANLLSASCDNGGIGGSTAALSQSGMNSFLSMPAVADILTDSGYDIAATDEWAITNGGLSGTSLTHYTQTLRTADIRDYDYLTVLYGTNDFYNANALDNENDRYDITTVKGAFRYSIEKLIEANPSLKIIVATPFYRDRGYYVDGREDGLNSDENANSSGIYLEEYCSAIVQVCAEYGIYAENLYEKSGITRFNEDFYLSDGLHPTTNGLKHLGGIFASLISKYQDLNPGSHTLDGVYYPGWTKKAITFSLDDGNKTADSKIVPMLRSAGMKATFSLSTHWLDISTEKSRQDLNELYSGFEIANHVKYHPYPYYMYASESGLTESSGTDENGNGFPLTKRSNSGYLAGESEYIKCVDAGHAELESVFGKGKIESFVWPGPGHGTFYALKDHVEEMYPVARIGADMKDSEFSLPSSWFGWKYNADHTNLYERALEFEVLELSDTDSLRWLCAGVHPVDYFSDNKAAEGLENMLDHFKNKPDTYWYAGVREIYDYTEALKKVRVTSDGVVNASDITVYIKVDGRKISAGPGITMI